MMQADTRRATTGEIIACPLFRSGYNEVWRGEDCSVDIRWSDVEQQSYERGRQFGVFVKTGEPRHVPLTRGGLAHPRALVLLALAFHDGSVL